MKYVDLISYKILPGISCTFEYIFVLLFSILVGFCISAVFTLPSIMYLINNSRVGLKETGGLLWPLNTYLGLLMTLISFNPVETGFDIFQNIGQCRFFSCIKSSGRNSCNRNKWNRNQKDWDNFSSLRIYCI